MKHSMSPMDSPLTELAKRIIQGYRISTQEEALQLSFSLDLDTLFLSAGQVTNHFCGRLFDTCSIFNVKSGRCSEDCQWCAQSCHFSTTAQDYAILPESESLCAAIQNHREGIGRFSLVASGRTQTDVEVQLLSQQYQQISQQIPIKLCASLGLLSLPQLKKLRASGVITYHCNLETAPSYFSHLCSTHTQAEKIETLRAAREAGMQLCSGGIIGMGETRAQRIELALLLQRLGIQSIPLNILHPIPGTPLQDTPPFSDQEFLITVALFRLINPTAYLRFSGGRKQLAATTVRQAMQIGINAAITGNLLTTIGAQAAEDMQLIQEMGYQNSNQRDWEMISQ